eukprot:jgi/Tetstr1/439666/TSEL_028085.t1
MVPISYVPGLLKQPGHNLQRRPVGAAPTSGPRKQTGHNVQRKPVAPTSSCVLGLLMLPWLNACSGGPVAPTNCVPGLRKRPGHRVHWRPDGANRQHTRAVEIAGAHGAVEARWRRSAACPGCEGNWGTTCSGGPLAPTNCVPGLQKRPGHHVQ